jgi:hypothetical protein
MPGLFCVCGTSPFFVIPAKAGTQLFQGYLGSR